MSEVMLFDDPLNGQMVAFCMVCGAEATINRQEDDEEALQIILKHNRGCVLAAIHSGGSLN